MLTLAGWLLALVALIGWRRQLAATRHWHDVAHGWKATAEAWHAMADLLEQAAGHQ